MGTKAIVSCVNLPRWSKFVRVKDAQNVSSPKSEVVQDILLRWVIWRRAKQTIRGGREAIADKHFVCFVGKSALNQRASPAHKKYKSQKTKTNTKTKDKYKDNY